MRLHHLPGFLKHYLTSGNEHSVHSPFVFDLLTKCIYAKKSHTGFLRIEALREKLIHDTHKIKTVDLGAGSAFDKKPVERTIRDVVRRFAKSPRYCRLLYRLTEYLKPGVMIELGTSLGISAMYQAAGNNKGTLYSIEGCTETAEIARNNIREAGYANVEVRTGNFDDALPVLLHELPTVSYAFIDGNHTHEATMRYFKLLSAKVNDDSLLVFDDINWSHGMKRAWDEIKSDDRVTIAINLYFLGIVFFNTSFSKQDFRLRY